MSPGRLYRPWSLEMVCRVNPVPLFTAVTLAPTTIADDESVTLPEIVAVQSWADAGLLEANDQRAQSIKTQVIHPTTGAFPGRWPI